ncbi:uncharacterized protein LOC108675193 [Hyalella azteca]|uniref:Uncharacterized protein LOC108675193 n=1 Tax=Hyalella azteca TaxID=294128 RepID=A0A8B7NY90_HYAAZ|nr:uncharacterized protein LOC108675193 [Hyalella azteca]
MSDLNNDSQSKVYSTLVEDQLQQLRQEDPTQYNTLVKMHLSFTTDLPTICDSIDGQRSVGSSGWRQLAPLARWLSGGKKQLPNDEALELVHLSPELLQHFIFIIDFLGSPDNVRTEGIFRKCGSSSRQLELRNHISKSMSTMSNENGCDAAFLLSVLSSYSTHDVASLLKSMLADLPEPLLLDHNFILHCKLADVSSEDSSIGSSHYHRRIKALQLLLLLLPPCNFQLLKALLFLLHNIALHHLHNRMSACNLGMVFAPHIMCPRKMTGTDLQTHSSVAGTAVAFMVRHATKLFQVPIELECDVKQYWINRSEAAALRHSLCLQHDASLADSCPDHDPTLANTVFSFVDRAQTEAASARETTALALAELYAHVSNLPDSDKKRKLVRQFNTASGYGTPKYQHGSRAKAFAHSIKKHLLRGGSRREPLNSSASLQNHDWQKSGSYSPMTALEHSKLHNSSPIFSPSVASMKVNVNGRHPINNASIATTLTTPNLCATPKTVQQQARAKSWDNLATPKNLRKCLFPSSPSPFLKKTNLGISKSARGKPNFAVAKDGIGVANGRDRGVVSSGGKNVKNLGDCHGSFGNYEATISDSKSPSSCSNAGRTLPRKWNFVHVPDEPYASRDFHLKKDSLKRIAQQGLANASSVQDCYRDLECRVAVEDGNASHDNVSVQRPKTNLKEDYRSIKQCDLQDSRNEESVARLAKNFLDADEAPPYIISITDGCEEESSSIACEIPDEIPCCLNKPSIIASDERNVDSLNIASSNASPDTNHCIEAVNSASADSLTDGSAIEKKQMLSTSGSLTISSGRSTNSTSESSISALGIDSLAETEIDAGVSRKTESESELVLAASVTQEDEFSTSRDKTKSSTSSPNEHCYFYPDGNLPCNDMPPATDEPSDSPQALVDGKSMFPDGSTPTIFCAPSNSKTYEAVQAAAAATSGSPGSPLTNAMLTDNITQALVLTPRSRCPIVSTKNSRGNTSSSSLTALALHNSVTRRTNKAEFKNCATSSKVEKRGMNVECAGTANLLGNFSNLNGKETKETDDSCAIGKMVSSSDFNKTAKLLGTTDSLKPNKRNLSHLSLPECSTENDMETVCFKPHASETPQKIRTTLSVDVSDKGENGPRGRPLIRRKSTFKRKNKSDSQILESSDVKTDCMKPTGSKNVSQLGKSMRRSLSRRLSKRRSGKMGAADKAENNGAQSSSISPDVGSRENISTHDLISKPNAELDLLASNTTTDACISSSVDRSVKSPPPSPFSFSPSGTSLDLRYSSSTSAALGQFFRHLSSSSLAQIARRLKTNNDPLLDPTYRSLTPILSDTSNSSFVSMAQSPINELDESLTLVFREYLETRSILASANNSELDLHAECSPCVQRPSSCCDHISITTVEQEEKCRSVPVLESGLCFTTDISYDPTTPYVGSSGEIRSQSCDAINILHPFNRSLLSPIVPAHSPQHSRFSSLDSADPLQSSRSDDRVRSDSLLEIDNKCKSGRSSCIRCNVNELNGCKITLVDNERPLDNSVGSEKFHSGESDVPGCQLQENVLSSSDDTFHSTDGEFSDSLLRCLDGQNPLSISYDATNDSSIHLEENPSPPKMRVNFVRNPAHSRLSYRSAVDLGSLLISDHVKLLAPLLEKDSPPQACSSGKENLRPSSNTNSDNCSGPAMEFPDRIPLGDENALQKISPKTLQSYQVNYVSETQNKNINQKVGDLTGCFEVETKVCLGTCEAEDTSDKLALAPNAVTPTYDQSQRSSSNNAYDQSQRSSSNKAKAKIKVVPDPASCSPIGRSTSGLRTKQGTPKPMASTATPATVHFETKL